MELVEHLKTIRGAVGLTGTRAHILVNLDELSYIINPLESFVEDHERMTSFKPQYKQVLDELKTIQSQMIEVPLKLSNEPSVDEDELIIDSGEYKKVIREIATHYNELVRVITRVKEGKHSAIDESDNLDIEHSLEKIKDQLDWCGKYDEKIKYLRWYSRL
ncbi:hypothetical protein BKI52_32850 [marine bacterium AO1-C]|nr:hypothetical protein BKI52_32850 [marine bacterium AO1-C]